uniref:Uncharacterized protein n=1 Tax=Vespula pensylvanica TaxID=30213 RepID=A0A834PAK7_VESPE|nr:hypothetical protein H0235_002727 [Vespula pensylvanica]
MEVRGYARIVSRNAITVETLRARFVSARSSNDLLKEISTLRIEQLDELENIFDYLEDNRNLKDYQGEKSARDFYTRRKTRRKTKKTNREASFKEPSQSCRLETD